MKLITDIYTDYNIMPTLQEHQLRVASVAKILCEHSTVPVHTQSVIKACLLHDMGNIIKFDLNYYPEFLKPKGIEFWQGIKDVYITKYGQNEHLATKSICHELGLSDTEIEYVDAIGFSHVPQTLVSDSLEKKICCYADQRVGPHGVLSIEDRIIDGTKRYEGRKDKELFMQQTRKIGEALKKLEQEIFSASTLTPDAITNERVAPLISVLQNTYIA